MKVSFLGNICNNHYAIAKALRRAGVDARLYLFDDRDFNVRPESDDLSLRNNYPDWIVKGNYRPWQSPPLHRLQEMMDADVIVSHADTALHFPDSAYEKLIVFPYGTDIFVYPFEKLYFRGLFPNPIYKIFPIKKKIRRVYELSRKVILCGYDITWRQAFEELLFPDTTIYPLGLIIDTETFRPPALPRKPGLPLKILQSCRQLWSRTNGRTFEGSKGNDIFFKGLAEAVRMLPGAFQVTLVDGKTGEDERSRQLLHTLELDNIVSWVPRMPRSELIAHYQDSDLVVDGLVHGAYGYSPLEALSCGTPVLMYVVENHYTKIFGEDVPIINAQTPAQVAERLVYYADHPDELITVGQQSRDYAMRQHSEAAMVPRFITVFESLLDPTKPKRTIDPAVFQTTIG